VCVGLAALLVVLDDIDPLTAYLATSPGGADSAAIIAMASNVDVAFVMAMQTARLVLVLLIGPSLASFIARRAGAERRRPSRPAQGSARIRYTSGSNRAVVRRL
jgi:uncharacterized membrane protein AbrB (regulator of aidB expression)